MNALVNAESAILPTMAPALSPNGLQDELVGEGKAWGLSASVDLHDCHPDTIRSRKKIQASLPANIGPLLAVIIGLFGLAHVALRRYAPDADPILLPLAGLLVYGGLARGRYRPGKSDVNVVVVLREAGAAALAAIAPALRTAGR